jgi:hypothetical protein
MHPNVSKATIDQLAKAAAAGASLIALNEMCEDDAE